MQSRRVSWASQGRIASSFRSFERFSYAFAKTSWNTSSESCCESRNPWLQMA